MVKKKQKQKQKTHQLINLTKLSFLFYLCPKKNESQRSHPDIVWIYTYKENQNGVPTTWPARSPQLVTLEPFNTLHFVRNIYIELWLPFISSSSVTSILDESSLSLFTIHARAKMENMNPVLQLALEKKLTSQEVKRKTY